MLDSRKIALDHGSHDVVIGTPSLIEYASKAAAMSSLTHFHGNKGYKLPSESTAGSADINSAVEREANVVSGNNITLVENWLNDPFNVPEQFKPFGTKHTSSRSRSPVVKDKAPSDTTVPTPHTDKVGKWLHINLYLGSNAKALALQMVTGHNDVPGQIELCGEKVGEKVGGRVGGRVRKS